MEQKSTAILNSITINGDGTGTPLEGDDISKAIQAKDLAWVHLDANDSMARQWLEREATYLDNIIVDALLAEETRPRIMEFENGMLLILRGVNLNENARPEDMISIRMWVDAHRIITVELRPLKATKDVYKLLQSGKGPQDSGEFIGMITARLFERMEPVFTDLDETLDNIEERVIEHPEIKDRAAITEIRKQAIMFRRYIAPQKEALTYLRLSEMPWLNANHKRRLQESLDRAIRYVEDLDALRERAQIVKDELANGLADKMNKNTYVLSVIASIFLPLGFLTGLMGINIGGMPGVEDGNAFWIFSGVLIVLTVLQVIIFKKLKWF